MSMRRFSTAIARRHTHDQKLPTPRDDVRGTPAATLADEDNTVLITPEDGDLWQEPEPTSQRATLSALPIFTDLRYPPEIQEELRWKRLCEEIGFERLDDALPAGFEDFDWSHVFPPDREHIALMAETAVSKGEDPQAVIDVHGETMAMRPRS